MHCTGNTPIDSSELRMRECGNTIRVTVLELRVKTNMALTCAVNSCSNGSYWLNKWKSELCDKCGCMHKDKMCCCEPPFR